MVTQALRALPCEDPPTGLAGAPATIASAPVGDFLAGFEEDFRIELDRQRRTLAVSDRGTLIRYELGRRGPGRGSFGWSERVIQRALPYEPLGAELVRSVPTAEVMAVAADREREAEVAELTLSAAEALCQRRRAPRGRSGAEAELAARLRQEVRNGHGLERVSVRPIQRRLLERMAAGEPVSEMCERGGFRMATATAATSWFLRRAGLQVEVCSRTAKRRYARTMAYDLAVRYAVALEADPYEPGV